MRYAFLNFIGVFDRGEQVMALRFEGGKSVLVGLLLAVILFTLEVDATPLGWNVDLSSGHAIVTADTGDIWLSPTASA